MSKHPYPEHVVEAVAKRLAKQRFIQEPFDELSDHDKKSLVNDTSGLLQALWESSRIDSVEDAKKLPAGTKLINDKGIFVAEAVRHYDFYAEEFPAHVIYWG